MVFNDRKTLILLSLIILLLTACSQHQAAAEKNEPAQIEPIAGTELNRLVLTEKAAQRLDIQTTPISLEEVDGSQQLIVPYSALIYDLNGETWVYVNSEPLTYLRHLVLVNYIEGDRVILVDGPPIGTLVVTVGVAELYGADTGVGK